MKRARTAKHWLRQSKVNSSWHLYHSMFSCNYRI